MNDPADKPHHPLPKDERARHDLLPEGIETTRDAGDDDPDAPAPSATQAPELHFRNPDGSPYDA